MDSRQITIGTVFKSRLLCDALTAHLTNERNCVIAEYRYGLAPVDVAIGGSFDVIVVQYDAGLLETLKCIAAASPATKLVIVDVVEESIDVVGCLRVGACGFVPKDAAVRDVTTVVRAVARGEKALPRSLVDRACAQLCEKRAAANRDLWMGQRELSLRERQMVALLVEGMSNKEIADRLALSTYTVKSHVHNILNKLRIRNRVHLLNHFRRREAHVA